MISIRSASVGLFLAAASFAAPAFAQDATDGRFGVNVGASTLGFTVEPTYRVNENLSLRMPIGGGDFDYTDQIRDYDYDGDIKSRGIGLLADYRPFGGGFRVSGGAFWTDYSAHLYADDVSIEGFSTDVDVNIEQKRNFVPALAVGYDGKIGKNGTLSLTAGGLFGKGFDVTGSESSGLVPQELVDEEVENLRRDAADLKVIPYVSLTVGYRF